MFNSHYEHLKKEPIDCSYLKSKYVLVVQYLTTKTRYTYGKPIYVHCKERPEQAVKEKVEDDISVGDHMTDVAGSI